MLNVSPVHWLLGNLAKVTLSESDLNSVPLPLYPRTGVQNGLQKVGKATSETQPTSKALGVPCSLVVATQMMQKKNFTSCALHLETKSTVQGVHVPTATGNSSNGRTRGMLICFLLPATSNKTPGQRDYSTRFHGNQLRAERWENWFLKNEV